MGRVVQTFRSEILGGFLFTLERLYFMIDLREPKFYIFYSEVCTDNNDVHIFRILV